MVIWGTDVVVVECREKFMKFITEYICTEFDPEGNFISFFLTNTKKLLIISKPSSVSQVVYERDMYSKNIPELSL